MSADSKPLFVRLANKDADLLDAAVAATGKSKRRLVSEAMREHLAGSEHLAVDEHLAGREHLARDDRFAREELTVGRISLVEDGRTPLSDANRVVAPNEVMTLPEAATFLRLGEAHLERSATKNEVPARRIAGQWRFSRSALLAWLGSAASPPDEDS
jgi:excisionase family DNA binding protein